MRIGRIHTDSGARLVESRDSETGLEVRPVDIIDGIPIRTGAGTWAPLADAPLPPVVPTKVVCVGKNYLSHATEFDNMIPADPLICLKPTSSIIGTGEPILLPDTSTDVQYEGELAVVVGKRSQRIDEADFAEHVLGYTIGNDVTARDIQKRERLWTHSKGYDTFSPLGPWIETDVDPAGAAIETRVNGNLVQDDDSGQLVHSVPRLLCWLSHVMTLEAGDVILTGTPAGVGRLRDRDTVTVSISGIGTLSNPVRAS